MSRNEDNTQMPRMVPDRDELGNRAGRRRPAGTAQQTGTAETRVVRGPAKTSGGVQAILSLLVIGMIATGGAAYVFYQDGQIIKDELADANGRLQSLENRLSAVGENSEETTLKMNEKINLNFSEIDKLWAARRSMMPEIEASTVAVAALKTTTGELETAFSNQAGRVNTLATQQVSMENRIETITGNIANLDRFSQQLTSMNQELTRLRAEVDAMETLASRVGVTEQDIESINVHRLQINQSLSTIQGQIQNLQNRLALP